MEKSTQHGVGRPPREIVDPHRDGQGVFLEAVVHVVSQVFAGKHANFRSTT